jgi:chromosome partitioning protein
LLTKRAASAKPQTTINLGAYLQAQGSSVLIVDLDPQANTTSGLGVDRAQVKHNIYHGLHDPELAADVLHSTSHKLQLIPSTPELAAAEVELVQEIAREQRLKQLLSKYQFDYVLIDCPPSLGLLTINALTAADYVMVPVQAEYFALEGLGNLLETMRRVKQALNPNLSLLGVLLTMHSSRTTLSSQVHDEVKKHFPDKVFDAIIPRNVRLAEAPSYGQPISKHDGWSKGARSYKTLAKEVHKRVVNNEKGRDGQVVEKQA